MSAGAPALGGPGAPVPAAAPASRTPAARVAADRPWLRLGAFAALGAYGLGRWATMLGPAPAWRLFGLLVVAVALAGGVPLLARRSRVVAGVTAFLLLFVTFPIAGVRWEWFRHLRIKVSAEFIGTGLERLPNVLVPYVGHDQTIRLVIVLGAAVLLVDAAAVLGFSGRAGGRGGSGFSDARRAAAALPLIALAIVPSTLIRPQLPYVQGLILFGLLVLFVWGERISSPAHPAAASAVTVLALVGVAGALAAPRIDPGSPWVNYRAWAGGVVRHRIDTFNWNQSYGPLVWPHAGHVVLDVRARFAEYWKAQDLDTFDGWRWVQSPAPLLLEPALPSPSRRALARWSQTIQVTIQGMRTQDVIAAGTALQPSPLPGGVARGADAGTWVAGEPLGPGTTYQVTTYTPHPGVAALARAGTRYPAQLGADLTLAIPQQKPFEGPALQVQFPLFHTAGKPKSFEPGYVPDAAPVVLTSPYARAYRLARRLEAQAATPYAYVAAVARYLSRGFTYSNNPPVRAYPLESFLFSDRRGYCQQFSGAMALLLRMGGIPARVAAGFTSGTRDPSAHEWVVSDIDAHAWVEVWFPHYGWIRFDPTPGGPTTTGGAAAAAAAALQKRLPTAEALLKENTRAPQDAVPTIPTGGGHARGGGVSAWPFALGAALALLLAAGARLALRFRGDADALLAELERALSRSGRPPRGGVTLAGLERRLIASPEAAAYVRTLRHARYGGAGRLPTAAQRRALRRELARGLGMSGRLRALWALPPRF